MKFIFGPFWVFPLHEVQQRSSPTRPTELTHQKPGLIHQQTPLVTRITQIAPTTPILQRHKQPNAPHLYHILHHLHIFIVFIFPLFFRTIHILHFRIFVGSSYVCKFMFLYILFSANAHLCVPIFLMFLIWTSPKSTPVCPSYYSYLKNSSHFQDLLFLIIVLSYSFYCLSSSDSFACSSS